MFSVTFWEERCFSSRCSGLSFGVCYQNTTLPVSPPSPPPPPPTPPGGFLVPTYLASSHLCSYCCGDGCRSSEPLTVMQSHVVQSPLWPRNPGTQGVEELTQGETERGASSSHVGRGIFLKGPRRRSPAGEDFQGCGITEVKGYRDGEAART